MIYNLLSDVQFTAVRRVVSVTPPLVDAGGDDAF